MHLILLFLLAVSASAQTLSITLTKADGTTSTRSLTGAPVAAGIEVIDLFRAATCTKKAADGTTCSQPEKADTLAQIVDILVAKVIELSDTYPTTATAPARAKKAQAQAEIDATKAALAAAGKPQ